MTGAAGPRRAAFAAVLLLPSGAGIAGDAPRPVPGAGRELGVPVEGLDRVRLDDGRVLTCILEDPKEPKNGPLLLKFPSFTAKVARERVIEFRRFADFDPAPRNEEEKALAAKGQVRYAGRWVPKERADQMARAEAAAAKKYRDEDDAHAAWDRRWQIDTEHFHIDANIPLDAVNYYADLLENFYDYFTRAFQITLTQRERKKKLPVMLFRRREEFRKFHDEDTGGNSEHLLGYFVPAVGRERLVFFDIAESRQETVDVMYHEGTHFIIHLAEPTVLVSRWIHEGCAEYFGASDFSGKKVQTGLVQDERLLHFQDMIARNRVLTMENLMKASNPHPAGEEVESFGGEHYAQAWTLVHYLMEGKGGRYRQGFISFLLKHLQRKGKMVGIDGSEQKYMDYEESKSQLLRCLGLKDFDGLMRELKEYALALPMRSAEAYAMRAAQNTFSERPDPVRAEADIKEALERGKDDPAVLARVARLFSFIPGKDGEAQQLIRRSLDLDPLSVTRRFQLSRFLAPAEALPELEICIQVDPDYGPALADYAWYTYLVNIRDRDRASGDEEIAATRKAIGLAERAVELDPSARAQFTLASLLLTVGGFNRARDAMKVAVEMDPEELPYLWRQAECFALLGQSEDFARVLRRIELLLRRASRPAEGETASDNAPSLEEVQNEMAGLVRRIADKCLVWERRAQAAGALRCWYERRLPKTEDEWYYYAKTLLEGGDREAAARIAAQGLAAFPESFSLKDVARQAAEPVK